jgi:menaquinone reductase, multiheme cytochrome c subunit
MAEPSGTRAGPPHPFLFPRWTNSLRTVIVAVVVIAPAYLVLVVAYAASPQTTDVGYSPVQPLPYSHAMHVGQLGMDCRYCHNTVEDAARAAVPPTQTCMNCHHAIRADSEKVLPIKESNASGLPIEWVRVHDLPGFVYFDHHAHVRRGVGCVSCHQRIDKMEQVYQAEVLSMRWCLDCHRNPEPKLRPQEYITSMTWSAGTGQAALGHRLRMENNINPSTDCSTCHR